MNKFTFIRILQNSLSSYETNYIQYDIFKGKERIGIYKTSEFEVGFILDHKVYKITKIKEKWYKSSHFVINDDLKNEIGQYKLNYNARRNRKYGSLLLKGERYDIYNLEIKSKLFKKDTWGYFNISLKKVSEEIVFKFRIEPRKTKFGFYIPGNDSHLTNGEIELFNNNLLLLMSSFYLLEFFLNKYFTPSD